MKKSIKRSLKKSAKEVTNNLKDGINEGNALITIANSLKEAFFGIGGNLQFGDDQVSESDTLQKSLRNYPISNLRHLLSQLYIENGLIKTIVDIPVDDGLSGDIEIIASNDLDDEDIALLKNKIERERDLDLLAQAVKWSRLYGGGGVLITANQDPSEEFKVESIKKGDEVKFRAVDMWELYFGDLKGYDKNDINMLEEVSPVSRLTSSFSFYGYQVHESRVLRILGEEAPSFLRPRFRGWGVSIIEHLVRPINQYLKASSVAFEVLDEFKIDVYRIFDLANTIDLPDGGARVRNRIQLANQQKNYQNAIVMDAQDEYHQKSIPFQGLAKLVEEIRTQLAAELRIPQTKLFGITPSGFNSGDADIENYNKQIESSIRSKVKFHLLKMIEIRCQQEFGFIPEGLDVKFEPLKEIRKDEEENIKTIIFDRIERARQSGEISGTEYKEACNMMDILPVKLEANEDLYESGIPEGGVKSGLSIKTRRGLGATKNSNKKQVRK